MKKYLSVIWLLFWSASISTVIISWDLKFVIEEWKFDKFLAACMVIQLEGSFIFVPYLIAVTSKPQKKKKDQIIKQTNKDTHYLIIIYDKITESISSFIEFTHKNIFSYKALIFMLFILSIIPAALQTSKLFLQQQTENILTEPVKPNKPESDEFIDRKINSNNIAIIDAQKLDEKTRTYQIWILQEENKKLTERKLKNMNRLDSYQDELNKYNSDLEAYNKYKSKNSILWFFETIKTFFAFTVLIVLQIVNATCARRGSNKLFEILNEKKEKIKKEQDDTAEYSKKEFKEILEEHNYIANEEKGNEPIQFSPITPPPDLSIDSIKQRANQNQF